jgi:hypothetical protein
VASVNERLFPAPRPESGADTRFTFCLVVDVLTVLARHGYPDAVDAASGADFVQMRQTLFGFLYGTEGNDQ